MIRITKKLKKRIEEAVAEKIDIVPYDTSWPEKFEKEKEFLLEKFPGVIGRIEHFGSTSIPGISAKPIVDMLIEVPSHKKVMEKIYPTLTSLGYDYFHRGTFGGEPPLYDWFIKRDSKGNRTHHLHMVKKNTKHWERLLFRDYLIAHPDVAKEYGSLKIRLSNEFPNDRELYTKGKTNFVLQITEKAKTSKSKPRS